MPTETGLTNLTAKLYAPNDLRMEYLDIREPEDDEVQINIRATGICGSDLHYYLHGRLGQRVLIPPRTMILGHESSGIVTKVGQNVTRFSTGDRVVIEPGRACLSCDRCLEGRVNLCSKMNFSTTLAQGPNDGTLREYTCIKEHYCHLMPDNMTYEQGALMEPIAVAVHSVDRSPTTTGSHVVVIGAGTVGLLVAAAAYAKGATRCVIIDINPDRLEFAKTYLPQIETILLETKKTPDSEQTPIQWAADQAQNHLNLDKHTIDVVFECTGVETCVVLSVHLVRGGGAAMLVGMGKGTCTMPTDLLTTSEITVLGTFRYSNTHPKAIELVSQGKIPTKGLVSHKFALKDSLKALDLIKNGEKGLIKIQIGDF